MPHIPGEPTHFCRVPKEAVCGRDLTEDDYNLFHYHTTNAFASITCPGCRDVIGSDMESRGFGRPSEWRNPTS